MEQTKQLSNQSVQQVQYQKHYTEMTPEEKIVYNSERTARCVSTIMWVMVLPLILGALFIGFYFLLRNLY